MFDQIVAILLVGGIIYLMFRGRYHGGCCGGSHNSHSRNKKPTDEQE